MLSRKKTKNEVSKPAEVQGKYVKKETSPLLRSECRAGCAHTWPGRPRAAGDPGWVSDAAPRGFSFLLASVIFFFNAWSDVRCLKADKE